MRKGEKIVRKELVCSGRVRVPGGERLRCRQPAMAVVRASFLTQRPELS